jgi:choice-of-anchor C domain-containing protein
MRRIVPVVLALVIPSSCGRGSDPPGAGPTPTPSPPVNLLVNGSLEGGPAIPSNSSYTTLRGGSTAIPGWVVTGSSIDYIGSAHPPSDGQRAVDLDGAFSTGGITQLFATTQDTGYRASFDLSGNPEGSPRVKQVRVTVGGVTREYSFDTAGQSRTNLRWEPVSLSFVASAASTSISFSSLSAPGNSWGAFIDHVAVVRE